MAKKVEEPTMLATLQDLFIFQMAVAGVPQKQIRETVGLDMNRVSRIAKLVKKPKNNKK